MSTKEKSEELIEKFKPNVYCYLGSGMLTNEYSEEVALNNAKKQALIFVNEMIFECKCYNSDRESYWLNVQYELENYENN